MRSLVVASDISGPPGVRRLRPLRRLLGDRAEQHRRGVAGCRGRPRRDGEGLRREERTCGDKNYLPGYGIWIGIYRDLYLSIFSFVVCENRATSSLAGASNKRFALV